MGEKLYNIYKIADQYTLYEIDKKVIKNKEYLLLLEKEEPNLICVGFLEKDKLNIVENKVISAELLKIFMEDKNAFFEKLKPFIDFSSK